MNTFSNEIFQFKSLFIMNGKICFPNPSKLFIQTNNLQVNFFSAIDEGLIDF